MNPASFHIAAPFLAADWFQLVAILLFFLISALTQYFQKRATERKRTPPGARPEPIEQTRDDAEPLAPPVVQERSPNLEDWQEQMRRLFEGEEERKPSPPLLPEPAPPIFSAAPVREEAPPRWQRSPEIQMPHVATPGPAVVSTSRMKTASKLRAAVEAYREASNLGKIVQARLRESRMQQSAPRARQISNARRNASMAASVSGMFRKPGGMRQAILAAAVLQPPTALSSDDRYH